MFAHFGAVAKLFAHFGAVARLFAHFGAVAKLFAHFGAVAKLFAHFGAVAKLFAHFGAVLAVTLALANCGSVGASTAITDATRDLREAKQQKADEFAVYYYSRAEVYLQKAKKLNGMGQFQVAQEYARTSSEAAAKSLDVARINKDQSARRDKFAPKKDGKDSEPEVPGFTPSDRK
ncbi:MAG: hypothetical protein EXR77_03090 [Myxococcales bacterium]|nr:hypothetical protein [Myxococcales bacterium]